MLKILMKNIYILLICITCLSSCQKEKADIVVINSNTYTVNKTFEKAEAFAIKDGKFIAIGTNDKIQKQYQLQCERQPS